VSKHKVALVQMNAGPALDANLAYAADQIRRARDRGAAFIATPENTGAMVQGRDKALAVADIEANHPGPALFQELALETEAWLLAGSFAILRDDGMLANRSYLVAPTGAIEATYDKIHLFDFVAPDGASYRESATYAPGTSAVVADTDLGRVGLSICYDVRFAALYRSLAKAGAQIICVPAAFTVPTGEAHWHVLLRARAIETGAFVLAPAQTGTHDANSPDGGRQTYGHSLIVAPWGEVLADGGTEPGLVEAELDLDRVAEVRQRLQSLQHDRDFALPS
jgi:predicted amidohydrolase